METLVPRPKDGWPKGGLAGMYAWQGDGNGHCPHLHQTHPAPFEQMHALGGCHLPADMLLYLSHSITEKHLFFATSVIESGPAMYNDTKYRTAPTWHYSTASSQVKHQSPRDVHWCMQGYKTASTPCGWALTKARKNYEVTGQVLCRYSSSSLVSGKSIQGVFAKRDRPPVCRTTPLARASSLTHPLQRPKTSKGGDKMSHSPSTKKFSAHKDSDVCAGGVFNMDDEAHSVSFEPMHNRLANKAAQSVDCNTPGIGSPEPFQISYVRANCIEKDGKLSLASISDVPLDRISGHEEECISMNRNEGKSIMFHSDASCMHHSSASSTSDISDNQCNGLMPADHVVTSASIIPLAINGCSQEDSQSAHSLPMNERWAGPAFSNSPPPSSLPVPNFTKRQSRTSSLDIPRARAEFLTDLICVSVPGTPSCSFSLPNVGAFPLHLDTNHATQSLKRLLNLDLHT